MFLGYPPGIKGYRLYDIESKRIFISRDVIFHEDIFPFHQVVGPKEVVDHFPDLVLPTVFNYAGVPEDVSSSIDPPAIIPSVDVFSTEGINSPITIPISTTATIEEINDAVAIPNVLATSNDANTAIRRSCRPIKPPSYLQDYHCSLLYSTPLPTSSTGIRFPIEKYLNYGSFSPSQQHFLFNVSTAYELMFYHQALPFEHWRIAMNEELLAMEDNKTWSVVPLPQGQHSIGCRWIYKVKHKADGSIERYKARLVSKGYTQQEGVDYI